jgi:signal transduction histidine kinase
VSHDLAGFEKEFPPEKQISFYRIIQECISNALKHATATALRITAVSTGDGIELVIQDNGKGFEKQKLKLAAQKSFGVLNLEERVRLLNGKSQLETSPGNGTKWKFFIPI